MTSNNALKLRIHGDNILECERALELISNALNTEIKFIDSPIYCPKYQITNKSIKGEITLLPGYGRWGTDIQKELIKCNAPVREAADVIVTKIKQDGKFEEALFSIEFCNALPAGNNAWQRTGRAVSAASVNIPYLYFTEIGGLELDENRKVKAARFPNPIIPFSYMTLGKNYNTLTVPIYLPSPSSPLKIKKTFANSFGLKEGIELINKLILEEDYSSILNSLISKNLDLINLLANNRKRRDTLINDEWSQFLKLDKEQRLRWLENKKLRWSKKTTEKVVTTRTFKLLRDLIKNENSLSIGAGDIPICLIPRNKRKQIAEEMKKLYGSKLNKEFIKWLESKNSPLAVVWITGFKPRGDDSRPDRGLVPLARMLLGPDVEVLSIVYGPAQKRMINLLNKSPRDLANQNGLWEAIINLSDALVVDTITNKDSPVFLKINRNRIICRDKIKLPVSNKLLSVSEHDVDSVIHFIFTNLKDRDIFECMCNPPGGDWSGLSFLDFKNKTIYRWTSLPRVSRNNGKRPDHVIEVSNHNKIFIISIESKELSNRFEEDIGIRLNLYTKELLESLPTVKKTQEEWESILKMDGNREELVYLSGGAYCYRSENELKENIKKLDFDFITALEFNQNQGKVIIHFISNDRGKVILEYLKDVVNKFSSRLEIKIH